MSAESSPIDFDGFHMDELPRRIAEDSVANALAGARDLGALGIRITGEETTYTYLPGAREVEILPGDARAEVLVEIERSGWEGLVQDLESPAALLYYGEVRTLRGDPMQFVRWEASLRALYTGRPVYEPGEIDLRDRHGDPLDPCQAFRLEDDSEDARHFLRETGYLFVKSAFSDEEIESFREAATVLHDRAVPGDRKSWWVEDGEGKNVLCRALQAGVMPQLSGLPTDSRILDLVSLADEKMISYDPAEVDSVSVLWKLPKIREGLADLPWHRDCGMGGHASMCPTMVCSIFLGPNTPEAGELRFLPGSWKSTYRVGSATGEDREHGVLIPARAGDLTIHYGDGWHAAPPPTSADGPFRSCVLVSFQREGARNHRGLRHYNDVLLGEDEGRVRDMTEVASQS